MQRRILSILVGIAFVGVLAATGAWAGNIHFVGATPSSCDDSTLSVSGKVAGLGDEPQILVVVSATAQCINPGAKHPKAANKESVEAEGDFPVQNGQAEFDLDAEATFQPDCTPPMTVSFTGVQVCVCGSDAGVCITETICRDLADCTIPLP
jgi:hypothetical protein